MTDVDIGNLALSFLGDEATLSQLSPPEGSDQAEHIAQFYPYARDAVLEMHMWPFATRRGPLTLRDETVNGWTYSYDRPEGTECLKVFAVLPPNTTDDYSVGYVSSGTISRTNQGLVANPLPNGYTAYQPVNFTCEIASNGDQVVYTNMPEAEARWVKRIADTTKFSPLFRIAVAKLLASFVAGPIYKGKAGVEMSNNLMGHFQLFLSQSVVNAGSEGHEYVQQAVPHISGR